MDRPPWQEVPRSTKRREYRHSPNAVDHCVKEDVRCRDHEKVSQEAASTYADVRSPECQQDYEAAQ